MYLSPLTASHWPPVSHNRFCSSLTQLQNGDLALPSRKNKQWFIQPGPTTPQTGKHNQSSGLGFSQLFCCCWVRGWSSSGNQPLLPTPGPPAWIHLLWVKFLLDSRHPEKTFYLPKYLFGKHFPKGFKMETSWKVSTLTRFMQSLETFQIANCLLFKITEI